ncbi:STAS/SEC14 domain-containing protein [Thalassotalea montiporae]
MLNVTLQPNYGVVIFELDGQLSVQDFIHAAHKIDPYIDHAGGLKGGLVCVLGWPVWESFSAFSQHLAFIRNHHHQIAKVAIVSNSTSFKLFAPIYGTSLQCQIRCFAIDAIESGKDWILAD